MLKDQQEELVHSRKSDTNVSIAIESQCVPRDVQCRSILHISLMRLPCHVSSRPEDSASEASDLEDYIDDTGVFSISRWEKYSGTFRGKVFQYPAFRSGVADSVKSIFSMNRGRLDLVPHWIGIAFGCSLYVKS